MDFKTAFSLVLLIISAIAVQKTDSRGVGRRRGSIRQDELDEGRFATAFIQQLANKFSSTTTVGPTNTSPTIITISTPSNTSPTSNTFTPTTTTVQTSPVTGTGTAAPAATGAANRISDEPETLENIVALRRARNKPGCRQTYIEENDDDDEDVDEFAVSEETGRQSLTLQQQLQRARQANIRRNRLIRKNNAKRRRQAAKRRRQSSKRKAAKRRRRNNRLKQIRQQTANRRRNRRRRGGR